MGTRFRSRDRQQLRAATRRRRSGARLRPDEAAPRTARGAASRRRPDRGRGLSGRPLPRLAGTGRPTRRPPLGRDRGKVGSREGRDRFNGRALRGEQAGRVCLDDGHHPPPPRRGDGASDRRPGADAADGGPAWRGPAADPRPLQHPGNGHGGRHAHAQAGDLRPAPEALRRDPPHDEGLRHARMPRRRRPRRNAVCRLPRRQPLRLEPRRHLRPQVDGQDRHGRLPEHVAQHRPRLGHRRRGDDHPPGARAGRRARALHAGEHVQLHPALRRRQTPPRGAAGGGGDRRRPRDAGAGRGRPRELARHEPHQHDPHGHRGDRAGPRADCGDRPHEEGVFHPRTGD